MMSSLIIKRHKAEKEKNQGAAILFFLLNVISMYLLEVTRYRWFIHRCDLLLKTLQSVQNGKDKDKYGVILAKFEQILHIKHNQINEMYVSSFGELQIVNLVARQARTFTTI